MNAFIVGEDLEQYNGGITSALSVRALAASGENVGLTLRQSQVLELLAQGKANKVISRELHLAEGTVKIHVTGIFKALRVANRTQAALAATRLGLDQLPRR